MTIAFLEIYSIDIKTYVLSIFLNVHSSFIHKGQNQKIIQNVFPFFARMFKTTVRHPYYEVGSHNKKEQMLIDGTVWKESLGNYVDWKKKNTSSPKVHILYFYIFVRFLK